MKPFTQPELLSMAKRYAPKDVSVSLNFLSNKGSIKGYMAHCSYRHSTCHHSISINEEYYKEESNSNRMHMRGIILHELGHIDSAQKKMDGYAWKNELNAQRWAIRRAIDLEMYATAIFLQEEIRSWKKYYPWNYENGSYRIYILASRYFRNII